jgi:hypothetical protein
MRYRLKVVDDSRVLIENEETGLFVGSANIFFGPAPEDPHQIVMRACEVFSNAGGSIAFISPGLCPLRPAPIVFARWEASRGFPSFQGREAEPAEPYRMERRFGSLLAEASIEVARAASEYLNGRVNAETINKCAELIAELHTIRSASHYGSFDHRAGDADPYFSGPTKSSARMSFNEAAQYYGLRELKIRHQDLSDATLAEILTWPLDLLPKMFDRLAPRKLWFSRDL